MNSKWAILVALLGGACSRAPQGSCALSTGPAGLTKEKAELGRSQKLPGRIPGGWLEVEKYKDLSTKELEKSHCSAFLTFGQNHDMHVWTAQHCFELGLMKELVLYVHDDGGYVKFPITTGRQKSVAEVRDAMEVSDAALLKDVTKLLHSGDDFRLKVRTTALERCLEKAEGVSTACFTAFDLVTFKAEFPSPLSEAQTRFLRSLEEEAKALYLSGDEALLEQYRKGIDALMDSRSVSTIQAFVGKVLRCSNDPRTSEDCSEHYVQEGTRFIEDFVERRTFLQCGSRLAKTIKARTVDLPAEFDRWTDELTHSIDTYKYHLDGIWKRMDTGDFRSSHSMLFATNLLSEGRFRFEWLPVGARKTDPAREEDSGERYLELGLAGPSSRTWLFKGPVKGTGVRFFFGDSGSMLLLRGIPIAAMSHRDGEPTSEGVALKPLPRPRDARAALPKPLTTSSTPSPNPVAALPAAEETAKQDFVSSASPDLQNAAASNALPSSSPHCL